MATLTYNYADQTAVLGPLATYAEPHAYDLCEPHRPDERSPRLAGAPARPGPADQAPSNDDLLALANLVREAGRPVPVPESGEGSRETGRRGHLRVLRAPTA